MAPPAWCPAGGVFPLLPASSSHSRCRPTPSHRTMQANKHRLLHGPYIPPALHRGDRTDCLYRDAEVVVTSWTECPHSVTSMSCARRSRRIGPGPARDRGTCPRRPHGICGSNQTLVRRERQRGMELAESLRRGPLVLFASREFTPGRRYSHTPGERTVP